MPDMLTNRDAQVGVEQAWHQKTKVVPVVTKEDATPFEVIRCPLQVQIPEGRIEPLPGHNILLASDDKLPVGPPFMDTYCPNTIETFWKTLEQGLQGREFKIISAGTVMDRTKIFASVQITDGFQIGGREFKDYITLLDSFDKSMAFTARYTNVCVVCSNTFQAAMNSGQGIGRAKHTKGFNDNVDRLVAALDEFAGVSAKFNSLLGDASVTSVTEGEARSWLAGASFGKKKELGNSDRQKLARMTELFRHGRGNSGSTRLDAFSSLTEFHTHESSSRKKEGAQFMNSEFGTSAGIKTRAVDGLYNWEEVVEMGAPHASVA